MKDERTGLDVASVGDAEGAAALVGLDAPTDPLATVPAEERQRILAAADRAANAQPMIAPSVHRDTIRREVAAWHAAHRPALESDREIAERIDADADRAMGQFTTPETLARAEAEPSKNPGRLPAERLTEAELAEIERAAHQIRGRGASAALLSELVPPLAAEVRALRAEQDEAHAALDPVVSRRDAMTDPPLSLTVRCATAARIAAELAVRRDRDAMDTELARAIRDTLGEVTHDGVIERLEELLDVEKESVARPTPAADAPSTREALASICHGASLALDVAALAEIARKALDAAPAADASLEARAEAVEAMLTANGVGLLVTHPADGPRVLRAVVRAVDASRPGLTEEQADAIALGCLHVRADLQRHAIKRAILRVDRGETGPARVDTVWTGISVIARPASVDPAPTWGERAIEEHRRAAQPEPFEKIEQLPSGLTCPGCYAATGSPAVSGPVPNGERAEIEVP